MKVTEVSCLLEEGKEQSDGACTAMMQKMKMRVRDDGEEEKIKMTSFVSPAGRGEEGEERGLEEPRARKEGIRWETGRQLPAEKQARPDNTDARAEFVEMPLPHRYYFR